MNKIDPILSIEGSGIPLYQRWLTLHFFMPRGVQQLGWEGSIQWLEREHLEIEALLSQIARPTMLKRVIIPSLAGLEDRSRNWSIQMTLEHLITANRHGADLIEALASGIPYEGSFTTDDLKPAGESEIGETLDEYRVLMPQILHRLRMGNLDRNSQMTFSHPWYGPLRAIEWVWVLAAHQRIHRRQIELILNTDF
jgi:hypothetical protein